MKKISRRDFLAASAAVGAAGVLTACGGSSSTAASTAGSAAASSAAGGKSTDYPTKGISVICPWSAGGGTDSCLRAFCEAMGKNLGVTLTVDNQTGGGGILGHQAIADANTDGYTIGMITFELATYKKLGTSELTWENYAPLCRVNTDAAAITVGAKWAASNGITDLPGFIDYCKAHPGEVQMGGSSNASVWHIAGGYLMSATGIDIQMITYQEGAATAVQNAAGGFIQGVTVSLAEARSFIESGDLICLGVMDEERNPVFPDVPTCKELRPLVQEYRQAADKKQFRHKHEGTLILYEAAAKALKEQGFQKPPDLYALKTEYKLLAEQKKQLQQQYAEVKRQMQEYDIIKQNVDGILRTTPGKEQMQER